MAVIKLGDVAVGTNAKIKVNGSVTEFIIANQEWSRTALIRKDIQSIGRAGTSVKPYITSECNLLYNQMDPEIRKYILDFGFNGSKVGVPSVNQLQNGWAYFSSNQRRIAYYRGEAKEWWTSTTSYPSGYYYVDKYGYIDDYYSTPTEECGIRPAFYLNPNLFMLDDGTFITNQPPTAPASITASNVMGGQQATVTLGAASDSDGQIINYTYERQVDGGRWTQFASTASLNVTDSIDDSWTTVAYRARAMDDMGAEGPYAISQTYTVVHNLPPTAPGSIQVTNVVGGQTVTITLTAATDPDGTVASYIYERQVDGGAWQQIANVNSLTQTDSILATWGTVAYRAKAVDNEGVSGPYATAAAETVNGGWILIGGPISNLGVQGGLFNLTLNIGVSGNTGVTGINLQVLQDGVQVYNNAVNQGDVINIPVDTRAMASGQHQIQAIADKDTFLAANVAWLFVVPSMALPDGGRIEQAQNADGEPIFFTTTTRAVIGPDGKSAQTQIDEINRSHQGITGHLAFVDAVMGPNASYVLARAAATTYAYQYYAPAAAGATGATLVSVYPGYNGAVGDLLTAAADTLTFNIPANGLLSIYQYNLDTTEPPDTDPTANFVTLDQPHVMTAATNAGNTADGLEDALTAMMRAFPSRNYYALNDAMDPDATYYVVSQAVIGPDTASATVAYVSSANPTTWYQGVQITLMNTSNIPALFDYISSPLVSAATTDNPVVAGVNLNATLATMIKAQPIYLRYQLESSTGVLYYVCSPTAIAPETVSAINVLYCTASGTYYNGETLTLAPPTGPTTEVT